MQRLEVSCAVRHIYVSLGAKGLKIVAEEAILHSTARGNLYPCFSHVLADLAEIPCKIFANIAGENVRVL